jgi:heme oxygenase (biliverdin-producing, ferredoxin)
MTTTATTTEDGGNCPYAALLLKESWAELSENDDVANLRNVCPAFAQGHCPFEQSAARSSMRTALQQIPPSHWSQDPASSSFYRILHQVHQVMAKTTTDEGDDDDKFRLPGGCPVQPVLERVLSGSHQEQVKMSFSSYTDAMESLSLSAIMANMIQALQEDEEMEETTPDVLMNVETTASSTTNPNTASAVTTMPLSVALKEGTAASHTAAENVHFVSNFIQGKISRDLFAQMTKSLFFVYQAMERALDVVAPLYFPTCHFPHALSRTAALQQDYQYWFNCDDDDEHATPPASEMTPATRDYVERLTDLAQHQPLLLLAHAYTRYLGDLSGGKILARVARRSLQLPADGSGLAFYEFAHVPSAKKFKDEYRAALDALLPTLSQKHGTSAQLQLQEIVREANIAFLFNMRLFEELDVASGQVPGAKVRSIEEVLAYVDDVIMPPLIQAAAAATVETKAAESPAQCPFAKPTTKASSSSEKATCPFAAPGKSRPAVPLEQAPLGKAKCPWPFILLHDPVAGSQDFKTWLLAGLLLALVWSRIAALLPFSSG